MSLALPELPRAKLKAAHAARRPGASASTTVIIPAHRHAGGPQHKRYDLRASTVRVL